MLLNRADLLAVEREACRRSLATFVRRAWDVLEPGQPYVHGWHIDAMAEHLEAITAGQIKRLLINVPPGTMKSMMTGVFWPAWEWGPRGMPNIRFIGASHEATTLATRDNVRMRRLVQSDWFQRLWPTALVGDQNEKTYFENDRTGWRQSCAVKSMTGRRGDRVSWDDPHSVEDGFSKAALAEAERVFTETLPTRLNNPATSAILVTMQRVAVGDVSGLIIARNLGWDHLCLPMEYEGPRAATSIGFVDPRTTPGELLFPERFPAQVVAELKRVMGNGAAGQLQQRPAPPGGTEFQPDMITVVDAIPAGVVAWCRGWDLGATEGAGDPTAGVRLGRLADGRYIVSHVARAQYATHKRDALIKATASADGRTVKQSFPQDPGQAGKGQAAALVAMLPGHICHTSTESGDKVVRARPFASQVNAGNVLMLRGAWNWDFTEELRAFPNGLHDDQVDGAARAFAQLLPSFTGIF